MKKVAGWILVIAMLCGSAGSFAGEKNQVSLKDLVGEGIVGYVYAQRPEDLSERSIFVGTPYFVATIAIPDDSMELSAYYGTGICIRLDENSFDDVVFVDGVASVDPVIWAVDGIVRPASVEIIGSDVTGIVMDVDDHFITIKSNTDTAFGKAGELQRVPYTEDTIVCSGDRPFKIVKGDVSGSYDAGMGCLVIYDLETLTALTIWESNG